MNVVMNILLRRSRPCVFHPKYPLPTFIGRPLNNLCNNLNNINYCNNNNITYCKNSNTSNNNNNNNNNNNGNNNGNNNNNNNNNNSNTNMDSGNSALYTMGSYPMQLMRLHQRTLWGNHPRRFFTTEAVTKYQPRDENEVLVYDGSLFRRFSTFLFGYQAASLLALPPLILYGLGESLLGSVAKDYYVLVLPMLGVCGFFYHKLRSNIVQKLYRNPARAAFAIETVDLLGRPQRVDILAKAVDRRSLFQSKHGIFWSIYFDVKGVSYFFHCRSKEREEVIAMFIALGLEYEPIDRDD